jgi:hypothetical protein
MWMLALVVTVWLTGYVVRDEIQFSKNQGS